MVEAREFIRGSLLEILHAIKEARKDDQVGTSIAPPLERGATIDPTFGVAWHDDSFWTVIEFDIAVTAKSVTEGSGETGFRIPVIEAKVGLGASHERTSEGVSRMKFSVPVRISDKAN